jgi:diguanylate cyclase (GGDEF)-like protein/PAS domain S-box-containing protein
VNRYEKSFWILFGAAALGSGIWAMHIIGLMAMVFPIPVSFNFGVALLSIVPAVVASGIVLWQMPSSSYNSIKLIFCGIFLGLSIGLMHIIGLKCLEFNAQIFHSKPILFSSLVAAVFFAVFSLKLQYKATSVQDKYQFIHSNQVISSVILGLSISAMHYIGMLAISFVPTIVSDHSIKGVNTVVLSTIIALLTFLILAVALIIPHMMRFKKMALKLQSNEQNLKIAAISFQTHEGIMVTDKNAKIIRVNEAFSRITGYEETEVTGKSPNLLKSEKHDGQFYKNIWDSVLADGKWSGEVWNKRKNGKTYPQRQTITAVKGENKETTHYISSFSDITELKQAEKEIETLVFYDPLTELPNRRLLQERLAHELKIARRYHRAGILFFLDLDRFKTINDSLGHSIGDKLLIETADRLKLLLRDTDTAVRIGGDEFVILANAQEGIHSDIIKQSRVIAEKVLKAINTPYLIDSHELFISASIGITLYTGLDETVDILLKRADTAMYQAKDAGKNTYRFYQQSMQKVADTRLKIEKCLRGAMANKELSLHYQPQFSKENKIIAAEALIRWDNKELGSVPPEEFIPLAEETGLIIPMGAWVIDEVCKQINLWEEQNINVPCIALNISGKQFHQADFVSILSQTLYANGVLPERIILEINETVFLDCLDEVKDKMEVLKKNGFRFAIDDFGTGYSSLTYLKQLPFDQLKIDHTLICGLTKRPQDEGAVKAIIVMARGLGLKLIAEGVETGRHLAQLSRYGCHLYQGYYFSKPLPAEKFSEYVRQHAYTVEQIANLQSRI